MSSLIIRPEVSEAAEKSKRNAAQLERRKVALAILPYAVAVGKNIDEDVIIALGYADRLLEKTKLED